MPDFGALEVDLHGLRPDQALRRVRQALHTARVRGDGGLRIVTGRGWGNLRQEPILRRRVESWLRGPEGRAAGVVGIEVTSRGGALDVRLEPRGGRGDGLQERGGGGR